MAVPTIDLTDDELAAVIAVIGGFIEGDKLPHVPRLDPLRAVLAQIEATAAAPRRPAPSPFPRAQNPQRPTEPAIKTFPNIPRLS